MSASTADDQADDSPATPTGNPADPEFAAIVSWDDPTHDQRTTAGWITTSRLTIKRTIAGRRSNCQRTTDCMFAAWRGATQRTMHPLRRPLRSTV